MEPRQKVYIVTFFKSHNFGSNIQAIGLFRTIKGFGYEVSMLDSFRVKRFMFMHPVLAYARIDNKIGSRKKNQFFQPDAYRISEKQLERIKSFRASHFKVHSFVNYDDWKKTIQDHSIFVSGSDIIWNPSRGYPSTMFLDFAYYAKLPRFSYGSSVGATVLPKKYYPAYKRYLGSMLEVGVREQAVADMLEPIIGKKPTKVVDPSMLLTQQDWDEIAAEAHVSEKIQQSEYILCYFVMNDPRYWRYVKGIADCCKKQIVVLPMNHQDEQQPYNIVNDATAAEFVWLIKNAHFICTDSFHACVMSMIYHKEFYVLRRSRKSEEDKYADLLGRYQMNSRMIEKEDSFVRVPDIDFSFFDKQMLEDRNRSLDFLRKTLIACGKQTETTHPRNGE